MAMDLEPASDECHVRLLSWRRADALGLANKNREFSNSPMAVQEQQGIKLVEGRVPKKGTIVECTQGNGGGVQAEAVIRK